MDNFTLNVKFKNGVIGRILGIYGVIEPPEHMMKVVLYGSKMNVKAEFSDNKGGMVSVVWDKVEYRPEAMMEFPKELGVDVYGHTKTVLRYMKHFEECVLKEGTGAQRRRRREDHRRRTRGLPVHPRGPGGEGVQ